MDLGTFEQFRSLIYDESGIVLTPQKKSLLESRIQKRLRALKIHDESEYLEIIETDASGEELIRLIDMISTNVTYFYREPEHFNFLAQQCARWNQSGQSSVRIWCAASSSGEEPYTIAITLAEHLELKRIDAKVLATDICTRVLEEAQLGVYNDDEVKQVPDELKKRYFAHNKANQESWWQVHANIRHMILFKRLNLVTFPYPLKAKLDAIYCRNVMIYFDRETRQKIIDQFSNLLHPGGILILSHTESLLGLKSNFEKVGPSIFQKPVKP